MWKNEFPPSEHRCNTAECCLSRAESTSARRHSKAAGWSVTIESSLLSFKFPIWNGFSCLSSLYLYCSHLKHGVGGSRRVDAAGGHHCLKAVSKEEMWNCCITVPAYLSASRGHGSLYLIKVKYYTGEGRTSISVVLNTYKKSSSLFVGGVRTPKRVL